MLIINIAHDLGIEHSMNRSDLLLSALNSYRWVESAAMNCSLNIHGLVSVITSASQTEVISAPFTIYRFAPNRCISQRPNTLRQATEDNGIWANYWCSSTIWLNVTDHTCRAGPRLGWPLARTQCGSAVSNTLLLLFPQFSAYTTKNYRK